MNHCCKIIDNCLDCDNCTVKQILTPDPFEHEEGAYCTLIKEDDKPRLISMDDWDLRKYTSIPNWCPKILKENSKILGHAKISNKKKLDEILNEITQNQSPEVAEAIVTLIHKGLASDQVAWEKYVAVSQLAELGVKFGEKVDKYKAALQKTMVSENVKYTVCDTEWGLDARYVCPECLQPVEKEHKFCPHCGKALSWFNAPKPSDEVRNKFIAYAQNGIRPFLRSTTSQCYHYSKIPK